MAKRTSITLPIRDAELIQAALSDAGLTKMKVMADTGIPNGGGVGCVELQLALQLTERIEIVKEANKTREVKQAVGQALTDHGFRQGSQPVSGG